MLIFCKSFFWKCFCSWNIPLEHSLGTFLTAVLGTFQEELFLEYFTKLLRARKSEAYGLEGQSVAKKDAESPSLLLKHITSCLRPLLQHEKQKRILLMVGGGICDSKYVQMNPQSINSALSSLCAYFEPYPLNTEMLQHSQRTQKHLLYPKSKLLCWNGRGWEKERETMHHCDSEERT